MSLTPLVLTGHGDPTRALSVSNYQEPAMQARVTYAPTGDEHGDMALGWSYQQALLSFSVFAEEDSEADARAAIAELVAALGRLGYETTVTTNDADAETWTCDPGSVVPAGDRTAADMRNFTNEWVVTIPVYPIRSV